MNPIIFNDRPYEIVTEGDDIRLEGFSKDLTLIGAYKELKKEGINAVGYYREDTTDYEDGTTYDYDRDELESWIDQEIEDFIDRWLKDGKQIETLEHFLN